MSSTYQQRYWRLLVEVRVHVFYLHHYGSSSEWRDKVVNVFLAITSSSSIAAWAIWQEYTWVWPLLIAASQVASAVKPFLPYNQRRKAIVSLGNHYQSICLQMENRWYSVAEGLLSDKEIHEETITFRGLLQDAERRSLDGAILPRNGKFLRLAESDASDYFASYYPNGE
jgi:hypothetical protein